MEIFSWLTSVDWVALITTILAIVGAASVAVHAIAPFTTSTLDDAAATFLDKVYAFISKWIALNPAPKK
jgi:hypothetical protein